MENEHAIKEIYSNLKCAEDWDREELINYALTYLKHNIDAINADDDEDAKEEDSKEEDAKEYAEYLYHHSSDLVGELAFYIYKCWEKDNEWHKSDMEYKD